MACGHGPSGRTSEKNRGLLQKIEKDLSEIFEKNGIKASVKSRQKKAWSVFRKMETKGLSFEQLSDILASASWSIRCRTATGRWG